MQADAQCAQSIEDIGEPVMPVAIDAQPAWMNPQQMPEVVAKRSKRFGCDWTVNAIGTSCPRYNGLHRSQRPSPDWVVYAVQAKEVAFWQGNEQRRHVRLRYRQGPDGSLGGWSRERLWP